MKPIQFIKRGEGGYSLAVFLFILLLSSLLIATSLNLGSSQLGIAYLAHQRSSNFNDSEESLHVTISWFRQQSQNTGGLYNRDGFYTKYIRTNPTVGPNDVKGPITPTRIKTVSGTTADKTILLSSSSSLGTSFAPSSNSLSSGQQFDIVSSFSSATQGRLVKATLIDLIAIDPSKDPGINNGTNPGTDFYPIWRVDSYSDDSLKSHVFAYVVGDLTYTDVVGFYGKDSVTLSQNCDSYISSDGAYGGANKRARCPMGSQGLVQIHQNSKIYGTLRTNGSINNGSPYGGKVCKDFASGCPNPGTVCAGGTCNVPDVPTFQTWTTYCPVGQTRGNVTVAANQTWTLGGNAPNQRCWDTVTINNNRTLTLVTTTFPYYIKTLTLPNNGAVRITPTTASGTVTLYIQTITGNKFNGNQMLNTNNRPSQLKLYYLGTNNLTLNGTAAINASVISPYAGIDLSGSFTYQGGIIAKYLNAGGSSDIHYDESLGGSVLNDVTYRIRNITQVYD